MMTVRGEHRWQDSGSISRFAIQADVLVEQLGIEPENMVMIGDTNRDVNVAKNIGCRSILTNRKDEPVQELGQDFTIRNMLEILALIQL